ncbi:MAG: hypothetical protein A2Y38_23360 [Spirochaetes bacterium GWB1_59_5]|nr:MAG: hypothetical protein A2Y38_23360 [Spirochaetes bacterium GWB1_59_5]
MPSPFLPVNVSVDAPPRGPGTQAARTFSSQTARATFAWGSAPGEATISYIGDAPVTRGAMVLLTIGAHFFGGICQSDTRKKSSGGANRELRFVDFREFLQWDYTFCAFNKEYARTVNGVRQKRYWSMLPLNHGNGIKTFHSVPYSANQIVALVLGARAPAGTIGTSWTYDPTGGGLFPQGCLNSPVYDFDCLGGKRLDGALSEICERTGTVFTLISSPQNYYLLRFSRKGYAAVGSPLPWAPFPTNSDGRIYGEALSGNASDVRVLGERNRYQCLELTMVPDWPAAWQQFLDLTQFIDDIFARGTNPLTNQRYNAYPGDVEFYRGYQDAAARGKMITVREYVALRNGSPLAGEPANDGNRFIDHRKFSGRSRMDMPAALYLQTLVLRAFRPAVAGIVNATGASLPLESLDLVSEQVCRVDYVPETGVMSAAVSEPADSNGLAIVKGYNVSADLWRQVRSDQFNPALFTAANAIWSAAPFQIDDSGEGVKFIIFDEPVFVCDNLLTAVDGQAVLNANFTLTIPAVKAALTFEAERYSQWFSVNAAGVVVAGRSNTSRDMVENAAGLRMEISGNADGTGQAEIAYADGLYAYQKAYDLAVAALLRQFTYAEGGYKLEWDPAQPVAGFGVALSSLHDRIEITHGPQGTWERIDFTNERQRDGFEPERDLDRRSIQTSLFPGQQQLREEAEAHRKISAVFRGFTPRLLDLFSRMVTGQLLPGDFGYVSFAGPTAVPLKAGTPLWKIATDTSGNYNTNTRATNPFYPLEAEQKVFLGVTVREGEDMRKPALPFQRAPGQALARVQGPVEVNDDIGRELGQDYLKKGGSPGVGKALAAITDTSVKLIPCQFGAGGGGGLEMFRLKSVQEDYITCRTWDGTTEGTTDVFIAKNTETRFPASDVIAGETWSYTYVAGADALNKYRDAVSGAITESQVVTPYWLADGVIFAMAAAHTGVKKVPPGAAPNPEVELTRLIVTSRCWAKRA